MTRRSGLGRGLDALLPPSVEADPETGPRRVAIDRIRPNPNQPRLSMDDAALDELAASIRAHGVLAPLLVRRRGDDFEVVAGERRLRAAARAGLTEVPILIRDVDDGGSLEAALVENLQREDLNPADEAAALRRLVDEFGLTHDEIAKRIGRSRVAVTNSLRLLGLPRTVLDRVRAGRLSAGHARALLGCTDEAFAAHLADRADREGLSVRAVETAVRARAETPARPRARRLRGSDRSPASVAGHLEVAALLSERLETRVRVEQGQPNRIVIEFADDADLERIAKQILE